MEGNRGADVEYKRRILIRKINEELSRYYPLPGKNKTLWTAGRLMSEGRHKSGRSRYCDGSLTWVLSQY